VSASPHRLDLEFRIDWEGTWHVGSGYGTALADRLIRRRGGREGWPFVPGSQVKGVLRHQAERLAATLGRDVLSPHASDQEQQQELVRHFGPLARSSLIVDRLFGSRYQGECLFVDDALPPPSHRTTGTQTHQARLVSRTAMDRLTGTVKEGHLFVTEVAEGLLLSLHGKLRARHPAGTLLAHDGFPLEYALLVAALCTIDALGGDKAIGHGRCRLSVDGRIRWRSGTEEKLLESAEALAVFRDGDWETYVGLYEEQGQRP
jgi:CRISPR/Cas system CMR subunit Cmr4 (Cas7 group RAMP superfamily)